MRYHELELGTSAILNRFLSDLLDHAHHLKSAFLVSPFVELAANTRTAIQIRQFLSDAKHNGAEAALLSDDTPARRRDFQTVLAAEPNLEGTLYLIPKLHAKCGLVTLRSGVQ